MRKILFLTTLILLSFKGFTQEPNPDLLDVYWYLDNLTIDGVTYSSSIYNFDPTIFFEANSSGFYYFLIDGPEHENCLFKMGDFYTNPEALTIAGGPIIIGTSPPCDDFPNGDCTQIHEIHYNFYTGPTYEIYYYSITYDTNMSKKLTLVKPNGDIAIYHDFSLLNNSSFRLNDIKIYPNPASNILNVFSTNGGINVLSIFNLSGQKVMETKEKLNQIDVSSLQRGIYFLEIVSEEGTAVKKFVKK